jgi:uncharacterized protein (TIGR01244 family)
MTMLNLPQESEPVAGVIASGQPTREQFAAAADNGVTTVINLRREAETEPRNIKDEAESAGMTYVNIPIAGPGDLNRDNAQALADAMDAADGKVLVHCGSSNRVGALLALKARWIDGMNADDAYQLGLDGGMTGLSGAVKTLLI